MTTWSGTKNWLLRLLFEIFSLKFTLLNNFLCYTELGSINYLKQISFPEIFLPNSLLISTNLSFQKRLLDNRKQIYFLQIIWKEILKRICRKYFCFRLSQRFPTEASLTQKNTEPLSINHPYKYIRQMQNILKYWLPSVSARGLLKKKLLLPLLLLIKLKLKALMPIFVAIIGVKSLKALILSKLAFLLVAGFLIMQLCKKAGMPMPMMPMTVEPAPPTPYGAHPTGPSTPASSYEPNWDPNASSGGPYSRVWDPHQMAYSGYYSQQLQAGQQSPQSQN